MEKVNLTTIAAHANKNHSRSDCFEETQSIVEKSQRTKNRAGTPFLVHRRLVTCIFRLIGLLVLLSLTTGCQPTHCLFEPKISYAPPPCLIEKLAPAFPDLSTNELSQEWGKELFLGKAFAAEMDLYRALTCFKRALYLIPDQLTQRQLEIEYDIFLAYYLGNKFPEAIEAFESSQLISIPESFPALNDLIITLYDAYMKIGRPEKACRLLNLIASTDFDTAAALSLQTTISEGNIPAAFQIAEQHPAKHNVLTYLSDYQCQKLSPRKAKTLNALLPGAGYLYVGQKKAALTSFLVNSLFIAASYQLYNRGYIPAAIILTSLEFGWYFGGINGAGLAANEYNERLYETYAKTALIENRLFPILMIEHSF